MAMGMSSKFGRMDASKNSYKKASMSKASSAMTGYGADGKKMRKSNPMQMKQQARMRLLANRAGK